MDDAGNHVKKIGYVDRYVMDVWAALVVNISPFISINIIISFLMTDTHEIPMHSETESEIISVILPTIINGDNSDYPSRMDCICNNSAALTNKAIVAANPDFLQRHRSSPCPPPQFDSPFILYPLRAKIPAPIPLSRIIRHVRSTATRTLHCTESNT